MKICMILINYDFTTKNELSFFEVKEKLNSYFKNNIIETNCLDFFDFDYLNYSNDVIIRKKDNSYISLKELLDNDECYTYKLIRYSHNVLKMFKAGSLNFKKGK